ncbi:MAG: hypothetical protein IPG45_17160 [Deltaproteobacteria bacterium]|nr:hypothetical protein [Deltaproteobacteria bacterium]
MRSPRSLLLLPGLLAFAACEKTEDPPPTTECAATLPEVSTACTESDCRATTGTKAHSRADVPAGDYLVISWVSSELFDNETINVGYEKSTNNGLTARAFRERPLIKERVTPAVYEQLFGAHRIAKINAEAKIRQNGHQGPLDLSQVSGTGIVGRTSELLPKGVHKQSTTCSSAAPSCGATALCVIPSGQQNGTCESAVTIKFRDQNAPSQFENVAASVRVVGDHGAIVTDDADNVPEAAVMELSKRFEEHIAPIDHQVFGEPLDSQGRDRDGNGVVIIFLTTKVAGIDPNLAGFFQNLDLLDPAVPANASSNGADLLYMQPPGNNVSLDQLSGTIGHEYQHLINYYAKVINRQSSQESVWLDEGLSSFAEDLLGYGGDSFKNVAAYLVAVPDTSLTGFGILASNEQEADSNARRGMAQLLVRYVFEQKGGADHPSANLLTDKGGVAAIKSLVQSPETGIELFTPQKTGKAFGVWVSDLLTLVAVDDANYPDVSCNAKYTLAEPATDAYTNYQRGLKLRTPITAGGETIPLNGPSLNSDLRAEEVPVPSNGGEIRTLKGPSKIGITGPAEDYQLGFRILPTGK